MLMTDSQNIKYIDCLLILNLVDEIHAGYASEKYQISLVP